uniref:Putative ovule protein n=1 Tax=Solanum chacoense TaxID=4108 RepID=A0A0V0H108_SOLCH
MVWNKWREGKTLDVIDKRLKGEFNESEVVMVLKLGLMCSNNEASSRPSMRQVMSYLEGEADIPDAPMAPGDYNGGFGFDENECMHSLASSRGHTSFLANGNVDGTFVSVSTAQLSCLFTDELPR